MPNKLPALPLDSWSETKMTLHLYLQILGKLKLKLTPRKNHWWYITSYVNSRGFTTFTIPYEEGLHSFEIQLDFIDHRLHLTSSTGADLGFELYDGLSVAGFFTHLSELMHEIGMKLEISEKPFDMPVVDKFEEITEYHQYDKTAIEKFWAITRWVDHVFKEFSGRFYGKTCPVHIYWHSFDLTVTRFNGRQAPPLAKGARISDKDAYSHENISFGFWAGDDNLPEPAFYSYTWPSPKGLNSQELLPEVAQWTEQNGNPMAILKYHDLIQMENPKQKLLDFLESAYQAGAQLAGWPVEEWTVPSLSDL